ncbi:GNAT family N-acetyltransferase [Pontixanthobacter luteolus]|uniref:GNAT family N-acetyltransferase n=1 Tax=Pontixanthobacter luteolus TaxID=295089 RepID=UPI0023026D89|nr:GNAT family N-acetyltransferase [Pontixanthobacter luteolus]
MATQPTDIGANGSLPHAAAPAPCADGIAVSSLNACTGPDMIAQWAALEAISSEPNPFYSSWGLPPAMKAFDPDGRLEILQFWAAGELCGLLPLQRSGSYYGYPIPHLRGWMHDNAFCGAPLVTAGHEGEFWSALLDHLDAHPSHSLFFHLEGIAEDGALFRSLADIVTARRATCAIVHRGERAMLASPASAEEYFAASMSGKKRKELRRQYNRLSELGELRFERRRDAHDLADWANDFLELEAAGWKGAAGSALASDPRTAALFADMLNGAAGIGKLERLALYLDDRPIAMLANFLCPPGAFSFKTAFDERYSRFSPGVLLQRENLDILQEPSIEWTDSCAAADHPMIERIWREKRSMVRLSVGIGGKLRQAAFRQLLKAESGSEIMGTE